MSKVSEFKAFDVIASEVNEAQRRILFSQYTYKTKRYIITKFKVELEKLGKENNSNLLKLKNIDKQTQTIKTNIDGLNKAVTTIEKSNCQSKKIWLLAKEKYAHLIKIKKDEEKFFKQKWDDYKKIYENIDLARELKTLQHDVSKKVFLVNESMLKYSNLREAFNTWLNIKFKQDQYDIIEFSKFYLMLPSKIDRLNVLITNINLFKSKLKDAKNENFTVKETCTYKKSITITKIIPISDYKEANYEQHPIDEDLPNLTQFCETMDLPILQLKMQQNAFTEMQPIQTKYNMDFNINPDSKKNIKTCEQIEAKSKNTILESFGKTNVNSELWKSNDLLKELKYSNELSTDLKDNSETFNNMKNCVDNSKQIKILKNVVVDEMTAINIVRNVDPNKMSPADKISSAVEQTKATPYQSLSQPAHTQALKLQEEVQSKYFPANDEMKETQINASTSYQPELSNEQDASLVQSSDARLIDTQKYETRQILFDNGIPQSLNITLETQNIDDSMQDFSKLIETPTGINLSSPKSTINISDEMVVSDTVNFCFGMRQASKKVSMFTEKQEQSRNDNEYQTGFSFNFHSPESKKKKDGFFSLFN